MTGLPPLNNFSKDQLESMAFKVKGAYDVSLPALQYYNYSPCSVHSSVEIGCRNCGLLPRRHQRVGATWLYLKGSGLLSDPVGSGKTASAALLVAAIKEAGELENDKKVVVVCRAAAVRQWHRELHRMLPSVNTVVSSGSSRKRLQIYTSPWEVLVISKEMLLQDVDAFEEFNLQLMVIDDVDSLRNRTNKQAYAIKRHARRCERVVIMTATPFHKKLHELHSVLEPIGGVQVLGNAFRFQNRYVQSTKVPMINSKGKSVSVTQVTGYKNIADLRERISPLILRRTLEEMDDITMPAISMSQVWLELHSPQRIKYDELREGVLQIIKDSGTEVKRIEALQKFHYGMAVCSGLPAIGEADGKTASVKLDWVMEKLEEDFENDKVIVFINNKKMIEAAQRRLQNANIEYVTIWGAESNAELRAWRVDQFWEDPKTQVMLGTTSLEQSLNLQNARHLVLVDSILNPARMTQLVGRIRRQGSAHKTVYAHQLLTVETLEERIPELLSIEQAVADTVWNETNEIFPQLSPLALLQLIAS